MTPNGQDSIMPMLISMSLTNGRLNTTKTTLYDVTALP